MTHTVFNHDSGYDQDRKQVWTTINGRKIYAASKEQLARTVYTGYVSHKERVYCLYCGKEWYDLSVPCECLTKDDKNRNIRLNAGKILQQIEQEKAIAAKKAEEDNKGNSPEQS